MVKKKATKKELPFKDLVALAAYLSLGQELKDDELLRLIMEIGVGMMAADEGSLLLLDKKKQELEFMITIAEDEVQQRLKGQRFSMHKGITGLAASTGEPQTGAPTYHGVKQADYKKKHANEPEAVLAAPMVVEGEVIGVITAVSFKKGRFFSNQNVKLYSRFAELCGMVVSQRVREEAVRNMLLGKEGKVKFLKPSDKAAVDIARHLGDLSQRRKDLMPLCVQLVEAIGRLVGELRWK
jgi:GAF domain-containing protein